MNLKFPFNTNKLTMNQKWTTSQLPFKQKQQVDLKITPKWNRKRQKKDHKKTILDPTKGQWISKENFSVFNSPKKQTWKS